MMDRSWSGGIEGQSIMRTGVDRSSPCEKQAVDKGTSGLKMKDY